MGLTLFAVGGVNSGFGGRQGKDEPAATGVYRGKIENVAEEGAVGLRVVAVEQDMGADNSCGHAGKSIKDRYLLAELCFPDSGGWLSPRGLWWPHGRLIKVLTPALASGMFLVMRFLSHLHHHHRVHNVLAGVC